MMVTQSGLNRTVEVADRREKHLTDVVKRELSYTWACSRRDQLEVWKKYLLNYNYN